MAAYNNGFSNMLKQFAHYYSSYSYPFEYYNTQQELYPYVQPQQQQKQVWNSYIQEKQQQQQKYEEELRMEEIKRNIFDLLNDDPVTELVDRRLVSFLETDSSFLTPWSWNPDGPVDHGSSTAGRIKIEPGSFFSDNLVFLSEDEKRRYLSGTDAELVSSEQTSEDFLDQTSDDSSESPRN